MLPMVMDPSSPKRPPPRQPRRQFEKIGFLRTRLGVLPDVKPMSKVDKFEKARPIDAVHKEVIDGQRQEIEELGSNLQLRLDSITKSLPPPTPLPCTMVRLLICQSTQSCESRAIRMNTGFCKPGQWRSLRNAYGKKLNSNSRKANRKT
jgi:hypothetical protein